MRVLKKLSGALLLAGACVLPAQAASVSGTLVDIPDGLGGYVGNTIDHISFSVTTAGLTTIDVLSFEVLSTYFDSVIWLFADDGSLDTSDLIAANDDGVTLGSDGSTSALDSYLELDLAKGKYILAIDACCHSVEEAVQGYNTHGGFHFWSPDAHSGEYQITFSDNVRIVPEPTSAALLMAGLAAVAVGRRRRAG